MSLSLRLPAPPRRWRGGGSAESDCGFDEVVFGCWAGDASGLRCLFSALSSALAFVLRVFRFVVLAARTSSHECDRARQDLSSSSLRYEYLSTRFSGTSLLSRARGWPAPVKMGGGKDWYRLVWGRLRDSKVALGKGEEDDGGGDGAWVGREGDDLRRRRGRRRRFATRWGRAGSLELVKRRDVRLWVVESRDGRGEDCEGSKDGSRL